MALKLNTAPAVEPVSLAAAKLHLRIDSEDLADDLDVAPSIVPGDHAIAAAYSLVGESILVSGYSTIVYLVPGGNGAGGTVDVKLQESQDEVTWSDVTSGAFTQVTESNDDADDTQEKAYTGSYSYLRAVSTVAMATCDFGVVLARKAGPSIEDDLLTGLIEAARQDCEKFQNRAYITQTWELWLDNWPDKDYIEVPLPPLQSITNIEYYNTDDDKSTMSDDDYFVDIKSEPGRVGLAYGKNWPSTTLRPFNGVCVTFVAGYGSAASYVPENIIQAIKLLLSHFYEHREDIITGISVAKMPLASQHLLWKDRVVPV